MSGTQEANPDDIIKIMIATDNHLGYGEKDPMRGDDSFTAFEEILELAVQNDVDFILLGGDLFHDATPSQNALNKCMKLLRRYTMGDRPISIEFLSDQAEKFADSINQTVNYQDPNLNISIPVYSIHGNHDDPSGFGRLSSLDLLSTTGLVNYFGKWVDLTKVIISPLMMRKGQTQLALYGLSHIHDARLARLFNDTKVVLEKPDEETGEWFNLMVLHQNRADRGPKNYLPEEALPDFLDLIIWGHEHDCRITPEENAKMNFFVSQPGSSVATSLAEGEAVDKHCGILMIHKKEFLLEPIKLKTVRPFIFESINVHSLMTADEFMDQETQLKIITDRIEEMIKRAEEKLTGDPRQPNVPLIRLRIHYSKESQMFNAIRFGQKYSMRVANPMDIILFKNIDKKYRQRPVDEIDTAFLEDAYKEEIKESVASVEDIVEKYFDGVEESKKLSVMSSQCLSEMCRRLVQNSDEDAAERIISFYKQKAVDYLMEKMPDEDQTEQELLIFKSNADSVYDETLKMLDSRGASKKTTGRSNNIVIPSDDEEIDDGFPKKKATDSRKVQPVKDVEEIKNSKPAASTRGRGRGRGSRGGGRGRGAAKFELDFPISRTSPRKQPTIAESLSQTRSSKRQTTKPIIYEIDSD